MTQVPPVVTPAEAASRLPKGQQPVVVRVFLSGGSTPSVSLSLGRAPPRLTLLRCIPKLCEKPVRCDLRWWDRGTDDTCSAPVVVLSSALRFQVQFQVCVFVLGSFCSLRLFCTTLYRISLSSFTPATYPLPTPLTSRLLPGLSLSIPTVSPSNPQTIPPQYTLSFARTHPPDIIQSVHSQSFDLRGLVSTTQTYNAAMISQYWGG